MKKMMVIGFTMMLFGFSNVAQATMILSLVESGNDVIGTVSGSVDTSMLLLYWPSNCSGYITPSVGQLTIGGTIQTFTDMWGGLEGPSNFGTGSLGVNADSGLASSGELTGHFGIFAYYGAVLLQSDYVSGTEITGTSTWNNKTLSDFGITEGTYTWTYSDSADAVVLTAAVPEPATAGLLVGAGLLIAAYRRIRRSYGMA